MEELDAGYQRDQLMLEVLLDIRDLLAAPAHPAPAIPLIMRRLAARGLCLLAPAARLGLRPSDPPADLVVFGKVWTGDSARPCAQGVATRGDTIVAVGDSASRGAAGRDSDPGAAQWRRR